MTDWSKPQRLSVPKLIKLFGNPLSIWVSDRTVRPSQVYAALKAGRLRDEQFCTPALTSDGRKDHWSTREHAERIAFLIKKGWTRPIDIEVGGGFMGIHDELMDGHHRLAAAWFAWHKTILASCGGVHKYLQVLLPRRKRTRRKAK